MTTAMRSTSSMDLYLLRFERIGILATTNAGAQPDHDWLLLHGFSGSQPQPSRMMKLRNAAGAPALAAGDVVPPFSCALACTDASPLVVAYFIFATGAATPAARARRARAVDQRMTIALAEAYVEATELVAETRAATAGEAAATDVIARRPEADPITLAFVEGIRARLERGAWYGAGVAPVLHDVLVFDPATATSSLTLERTYPADGRACNGARTVLQLGLERPAGDQAVGRQAGATSRNHPGMAGVSPT